MAFETNVMGTRYILQLIISPPKGYSLNLMFGGVIEEKIAVKNLTLRLITESIVEILSQSQATVNSFQVDIMAKDLYSKSTGDQNLEKHDQSMTSIKEKQELSSDPKFKNELRSEFHSTIQRKPEPHIKRKEKKTEEYKVSKEMKQAAQSTEMKDMVSEMSKSIQHKPVYSQAEPQNVLSRQHEVIDIGVSSVDIDDLLQELNETQSLIKTDLLRINQRMEKLDAIIFKISSISSKF